MVTSAKPFARTLPWVPRLAALAFLVAAFAARAQMPPTKAAPPQAEAKDSAPPYYSIELLETRVRFEAGGSSRRETHTILHLHTLLGARQFARLSFEYNRAYEELLFALVRVTHPGGGIAEILPGAVSDQPLPAVADAPAYQDVRQKSVRIPGLQPGDTLEYRVTTAVTQAPLAPDFFLSHAFVRDVFAAKQIFALDLPAARPVQLRAALALPAPSLEISGEGSDARKLYRWEISGPLSPAAAQESASPLALETSADIALTSFASWADLAAKLAARLSLRAIPAGGVLEKSAELTRGAATPEQKIEALYTFVSQRLRTVDLPLGATGYRVRPPAEILSSAYATPEEKTVLLVELAAAAGIPVTPALAGAPDPAPSSLPMPPPFSRILAQAALPAATRWLDPSLEVAPFGVISSNLRGKPVLLLRTGPASAGDAAAWTAIPADLPFAATQRVAVDAVLAPDGKLSARIRYVLRGDNELVLRMAFHRASREHWKDLAQLLALADGFRGSVNSVNASDPSATADPFTVEYEIVQPKFVDWSKQPVRIPALLPLFGLPEVPAKSRSVADTPVINLGTPLDIEARSTLRLPPRTSARGPAGTSVARDYAAYTSKYAAQGTTLRASRRLNFILREIPAGRTADYSAFVRAVQNDEAQEFTFGRAAPRVSPAPKPKKSVARSLRP